MLYFKVCFILAASLLTIVSHAANPTAATAANVKSIKVAPVLGFAQSFLTSAPIPDANITVLETGKVFKTNNKGEFGPILYPVGKRITLVFEKGGYKTTQSATIKVPKEGLTDTYHQISFQVPSTLTFRIFAYIIGATVDENSCHVATTITAKHKTLQDIPQGEIDAYVTLHPKVDVKPFYFDIFKIQPVFNKTNPLTKGLERASEDGGVAFFNLPPSDNLYTISAKKEGLKFSSAQFICRKGAFINISPPRGPSVIG